MGSSLFRVLVFKIILLIFFFTISCSQEGTIRIGVAVNLSGKWGRHGEFARDGAFLAAKAINSSGGVNGKKVEILVEDNRNTPEGILEADRKLLEKKVIAIIGHHCSWATVVSHYFLEGEKVIEIVPYAAYSLFDETDDNLFRLLPSNSYMARKMAEIIGKRKTLVVCDLLNEEFSIDFYLNMKDYSHGEISIFYFDSKSGIVWKDFIEKVREEKPSSIVLITIPPIAGLMADKLYDLGFRGDIFLTSWTHSGDLLRYYDKGLDGAKILTFFSPYMNPRRIEEIKRGGISSGEVNLWNALGYDAVMVLCKAVEMAKSTSFEDIKKALLEGEFDTIYGRIRFDRYGDIKPALHLVSIRGRSFYYERRIH